MVSKFEPPKKGEKVIDSADGQERVRWLLTEYLRRPQVFIRAPYGNFDDLMCDPEGYVWGVIISNVPENPGVQVIRCTDYLIGLDNAVIEQPIKLAV